MKGIVLTLGIVLAAAAPCQAGYWDILDETYGPGPGKISFAGSYLWPWSDTPTETLSNGHANLTHGSGIDYAARANGTINLPAGQWRMDVKIKLDNALGLSFYLGDKDDPASLALVQVNALFQETVAHPNTISDYNLRIPNGGEIQPAGFDGSAPHVYSFRYGSGDMEMYLDGAHIADLIHPAAGVDAGYEALQFGFGASKSPGPGTSHIYYARISSQIIPEPSSLGLLAIGIVGLVACDRRRRRGRYAIVPRQPPPRSPVL